MLTGCPGRLKVLIQHRILKLIVWIGIAGVSAYAKPPSRYRVVKPSMAVYDAPLYRLFRDVKKVK